MVAPARTTTEEWVDAGYEALCRGGLQAIQVRSIANELGVSRSSFYHRFADREALVEAVLQRWWDRAIALQEKAMTDDDPESQLRGFGRAVLCDDVLRRADGWLLLHDPTDPAFPERAATSRGMVEPWATEVLMALGVSPQEARRRAYLLYTGYLGLLADIEASPDRPTDAEIVERFDGLVDMIIAV